MSGLAQFVAARGLGTLQEWCEEGYNAVTKVDRDLSGEGHAETAEGAALIPELPLLALIAASSRKSSLD